MDTYSGKNIWIIGSSSGIGRALAIELSSQGATLALSARREGKLIELNKDLGDKHIVLPVDVSDPKALAEAANSLTQIDSVIFMPAIYAPHSPKPKDLDFVHEMININLGGAFNTVYAVMPHFEKQGFGQIALCASVAGYRGLPYGQPYCATKAALISYAESLKTELEQQHIDVKVINPGFVCTPLTDKNKFPMPMIINAEDAAKTIAKGLRSKCFEIHFPKRFTFVMKVLNLLPNYLYFIASRVMRSKQTQ